VARDLEAAVGMKATLRGTPVQHRRLFQKEVRAAAGAVQQAEHAKDCDRRIDQAVVALEHLAAAQQEARWAYPESRTPTLDRRGYRQDKIKPLQDRAHEVISSCIHPGAPLQSKRKAK
jgi:hypothetical protein